MRAFKTANGANINKVRSSPKQTNEVGSLSSLLGLWIFIPLSISGITFVLLQLIFSIFLSGQYPDTHTQIFLLTWILISIFSQTVYWMWITQSIGMSAFQGLWALVPIFGLVKTFRFSYSLTQKSGFEVSDEKKQVFVSSEVEIETIDTQQNTIDSEQNQLKEVAVVGSSKKGVLVIGLAILLALIGFFVTSPNYNDYKAKSSASKLISELQAVMNTSARRPLDFSTYADKLNPSFDDFLAAGSDSWKATNTNCDDKLYNDLRFTFGGLRQADKSFNLYPETIIGLLNMYIKSCE